jgi:hypothetical protein
MTPGAEYATTQLDLEPALAGDALAALSGGPAGRRTRNSDT